PFGRLRALAGFFLNLARPQLSLGDRRILFQLVSREVVGVLPKLAILRVAELFQLVHEIARRTPSAFHLERLPEMQPVLLVAPYGDAVGDLRVPLVADTVAFDYEYTPIIAQLVLGFDFVAQVRHCQLFGDESLNALHRRLLVEVGGDLLPWTERLVH